MRFPLPEAPPPPCACLPPSAGRAGVGMGGELHLEASLRLPLQDFLQHPSQILLSSHGGAGVYALGRFDFLVKMFIMFYKMQNGGKGGESGMKRAISIFLSLFVLTTFTVGLAGCGADIKAENEKLKAENTTLKSDNDKLKLEVQKLKEEIQKAAEKEATLASLTAENEALKKQVEDLKVKLTPPPKKKR